MLWLSTNDYKAYIKNQRLYKALKGKQVVL